jgi:DNA-binding transcriptional ArsR family regulator
VLSRGALLPTVRSTAPESVKPRYYYGIRPLRWGKVLRLSPPADPPSKALNVDLQGGSFSSSLPTGDLLQSEMLTASASVGMICLRDRPLSCFSGMALNKILRALNRYTCRKVLDELRRGPKSVGNIAASFTYSSRPNVSQALQLLLEAGLVTRRRQGRLHFYEIKLSGFKELDGYLDRFSAKSESNAILQR